jgi:hypothetical protein
MSPMPAPAIATSAEPAVEPAAAPVPAPEPRTTAVRSSSTAKVTYQIPLDLRDRVNAMFMATRAQEGERSFSEMVSNLLEREAIARENRYNGGRRFEPHAGQLPVGRPIGTYKTQE